MSQNFKIQIKRKTKIRYNKSVPCNATMYPCYLNEHKYTTFVIKKIGFYIDIRISG